MNKNKLSIILALFLIVMSSCEDRLELLPEDDIAEEIVFNSEVTALGAVVGIYNRAQQDDVLNGTLQFMTEWQSDNVAFEGTFSTFEQVSVYSTLATNTSIFGIWDDNYETIGAANLVIDNVPLVPGEDFTEAERTQAIAEARFMRALVYFNVSTVFGQPLQVGQGRSNLSVPLVLTSETGLEIPRATLGEVQDFVESELLAVIPLLASGTRIKANPGAARALLARLYLYQERWEEAANMANMVISDSFYELATDYTFFDQPAATEHVFTLVNNEVDGQDTGQGWSGLSNPQPEGRGDVPFTQNLLDAYAEEAGDLRFTTLNQEGPGAISPNAIFTNKFPDGVNNADDAPVMRVTEMYLTRAEANLRAGTSVGDTPVNDINRLRSRAGLGALGSVDLDIILNERRKELAFEGQRRMDLLRNGLNLRRPGQPQEAQSAPGQNLTIFPIPQQVRDLSPFVEQNPGY
ncbi:RagB/SusD family nutrient uptake outer membrane protein [Muricauda sp. SCSIO 64092]|uniref:RagB/SusD family nutrient uptake outer membrane protein n=1 Tax=Allomuricauda sp. SCSIO 64092 TaxID=2908842 RepID=UPI001FF5B15C|nr:RagB/SusD family nutrient uptake outer membrane protein [Muricauda sp. SCSIO 64092]UOY05101.1 RagB/SusD family nutrient uptake outer membrane protein [Muricauda sp. SCSIO 64092]